jgi:hypothetical protein
MIHNLGDLQFLSNLIRFLSCDHHSTANNLVHCIQSEIFIIPRGRARRVDPDPIGSGSKKFNKPGPGPGSKKDGPDRL